MAELEDMLPTVYPDGSVIGSLDASGNLPENPELLHRPHAFALMHGDDGAKVAYGQLVYKTDILTLDYKFLGSHSDHTYVNNGAGQDAIGRLLTVVPRIDTDDGDVMDSTIPNIYHQLDGYGDVYLNWEILLEEGSPDHVSKCWVSTTAGGQSEAGTLSVGNGANDFDDRGSDAFGSYRVKLGTVNENDPISQLISSDVYWTIFGLKRTRS